MSWGIEFKTEIFLEYREHQTNVSEVEAALDNLDVEIAQIESSLNMLASATLRDILPSEWNDSPIQWLYQQTNDLFNELKSNAIKRYQLQLYLQYLQDEDTKDKE